MAMGASLGLILLDETVVGVALPTLQKELGMSQTAAHWVFSAYLLVFAGFCAAGGKLLDILHFRDLLVIALAIFGLGSLVAGFAENGTELILARALQGLGAASILPATLAAVSASFPKEQRGMAIGIMSTAGLVFMGAGPLVGGVIVHFLSWPWIFWINVPVVILIALVFLIAWKPQRQKRDRPKLDVSGLMALIAALTMLVLAIMQGDSWGWENPIILALFAGSALTFLTLVLIERRHATPLIDLELLTIPTVSAYNSVVFVAQFSKMAVVVFVALYLQERLNMTPLMAGFALLAAVGIAPFMSLPAGWLTDHRGARRTALLGLSCATLAMLWIAVSAGWHNYLLMLPGLVLWGAAMPICFMPSLTSVMNSVPPEEHGQAGGVVITARLLGSCVGMAVSSMLYVSTDSFQVVFLVTGLVMLAALLFGWLAMERSEVARAT